MSITKIRELFSLPNVHYAKKYGSAIIKVIKQLYIVPNSIQNSLMVRMKEKTSYIIVTEQFKKLCESANLKGINLIEEGASIYTNI